MREASLIRTSLVLISLFWIRSCGKGLCKYTTVYVAFKIDFALYALNVCYFTRFIGCAQRLLDCSI